MEQSVLVGDSKSKTKIQKTPAFHPPLRPNEILISRKKPKVVYLKRLHELFFDLNQTEVFVQAIGAAVQMAVDLALTTQETYAGITFETVNTFTMPLRDLVMQQQQQIDKEGIKHSIKVECPEQEIIGEKMRLNSGICIKINKKSIQ